MAGHGTFRPTGTVPISLLAAVFAPQVAFLALYFFFPGTKKFVHSLDLSFLIAVQCCRAVGLVMLFLWAYGLLRGGFAMLAAVGDLVVAISAAYTLPSVSRRTRRWRLNVIALSAAGLADFLLALWAANFGSALAIDPEPIVERQAIISGLPLVMVPAFLVPLFSCAHFAALAQAFKR